MRISSGAPAFSDKSSSRNHNKRHSSEEHVRKDMFFLYLQKNIEIPTKKPRHLLTKNSQGSNIEVNTEFSENYEGRYVSRGFLISTPLSLLVLTPQNLVSTSNRYEYKRRRRCYVAKDFESSARR